jgi:hypothetical protein
MAGYRTRPEGKLRLDVVSRFCLRRLQTIADKGPRGKTPSEKEIATASFAAFNPSVFGGETLGSIMALQKHVYPDALVPIILPFLCDGLLALNGLGTEGTFRVSGDADAVTEVRCQSLSYFARDCHSPDLVSRLAGQGSMRLGHLRSRWRRRPSCPSEPAETLVTRVGRACLPFSTLQRMYRQVR